MQACFTWLSIWFVLFLQNLSLVNLKMFLYLQLFQIRTGMPIEKDLGPVRMFFIYMISGVGGNLVAALFTPGVGNTEK